MYQVKEKKHSTYIKSFPPRLALHPRYILCTVTTRREIVKGALGVPRMVTRTARSGC